MVLLFLCTYRVPTRSFLPPGQSPILVDLRPQQEFVQRHLIGSSSVPVDHIAERMYELPPPGEWPLTLLGTAAQIAQAQELIQPRGWCADELIADPSAWPEVQVISGASSEPTSRPNSFLAKMLQAIGASLPEGTAVDFGCGSGCTPHR